MVPGEVGPVAYRIGVGKGIEDIGDYVARNIEIGSVDGARILY